MKKIVEHGIWEWAILRPRGQGKKGQLIWMQMLSKGKIQSADDFTVQQILLYRTSTYPKTTTTCEIEMLETGQHSYCARNHEGPCM